MKKIRLMDFFPWVYNALQVLDVNCLKKMNKQENRGVYLVDKTEKRRAFLVDNCFPVF